MRKKWQNAILDNQETVAVLKNYFRHKTEKEFPDRTVKVYYEGSSSPHEADWKEKAFAVSVYGINAGGERNSDDSAKLEKVVNGLKEIFPDFDFKGDAGICVRMDRLGNGFSVFGNPTLLANKIIEKDKTGWSDAMLDKGGILLG